MHIELRSEILSAALGHIIGVIEKRSTMPILSYILVEANDDNIEIIGTDLEVEIRTKTDAIVKEAGITTLPARKLYDLCRFLPEGKTVAIRTDGETGFVTADRAKYRLAVLPEDSYPRLELDTDRICFELNTDILRHMLDKTSFAMAQQDVRYYLNGLLLVFQPGRIIAVSTDGHRLARYEVEDLEINFDAERQLIIPNKATNELKRLVGSLNGHQQARIELSDRIFRAEMDQVIFASKLVDGRFPDFERVIPNHLDHQAKVSKEGLKDALMRTALISNDKYRGAQFIFEDSHLKLAARNQDQETAEEDLDIDYSGGSTTIGFNITYVMDVLNAVDTSEIEILFSDSASSTIWRGGERETFVIMPMRL